MSKLSGWKMGPQGIDARRFCCVLVCLVLTTQSALANGFFDGPDATPGDPMFFSIYSVLKSQKGNANLQKIADGGFTTAGPHYLNSNGGDPISHPEVFYSRAADAVEAGLGIIGHITWHPDVVNDTSGMVRPNSMNAISEANIRAHVRQVMDFTLDDPLTNAATQKWYTLPEELRPWMSHEMRYLNIVADEVKSYDPQGRPVSMYNPNHRAASQLDAIIGEGLDETLMGAYVTGEPFSTRGARVALGADRILASSLSTGTTPVIGMQLSTDLNTTELNFLVNALGSASIADAIEHVVRHDVYQGILRGIEGVHIWSGCDCRSGLSTYSEQLDGYISVASDMNQELGLADVFLQGQKRNELSATVLSGPSTVTWDGDPGGLGAKTVDTVTVSDIAYGGDRYLFMANSSNTQLDVQVNGLPMGLTTSQVSDVFDNAPGLVVDDANGILLLDMQPLEVIALKFTPGPAGDYNGDGVTDAADYTVWRDNLDSGSIPNNETASLGVVDQADFTVWRDNFGQAGSNDATAVPSPSAFASSLTLITSLLLARLRSAR